jgi:hypothetical protein
MGSASQQLSQLTDGGSLSLRVWPIFSYVLPYFRLSLPGFVLASFQSILDFLTSGFLSYFLVSFLPFLFLKGLVYANYSLSWTSIGYYAPSLEARKLIVRSAPRSCC